LKGKGKNKSKGKDKSKSKDKRKDKSKMRGFFAALRMTSNDVTSKQRNESKQRQMMLLGRL
jgi:hypothetical protein